MPADPRAVRAWIAVALWTALVWSLSTDGFSASSTSRLIGPLLRWLFPDLPAPSLAALHGAVRKAAHVVEYAVLAALVFRALRLGAARAALASAGLAFCFVLAVAGADELRQSRSRARSGAVSDVALDAGGAALALALLIARHARNQRRTLLQAARALN